ncbi:uncharacterized protein RHO17_017757 [Thomomys bottae]
MLGSHALQVRSLYRRILLLHRVLPPDLKALGDQYVKDELRRILVLTRPGVSCRNGRRMQQCYGNKLKRTNKILEKHVLVLLSQKKNLMTLVMSRLDNCRS